MNYQRKCFIIDGNEPISVEEEADQRLRHRSVTFIILSLLLLGLGVWLFKFTFVVSLLVIMFATGILLIAAFAYLITYEFWEQVFVIILASILYVIRRYEK